MFNILKKKKNPNLEYLRKGKNLKNIEAIDEQIKAKVSVIEYGYKDDIIYINNEGAALYIIVNSTAKMERLAEAAGKDNDGIMLDIGANCGVFSYFYKKLHPKSRVYLFEPNQLLMPIISKNLRQFDNYEVIPAAVSNKEGTVEFFSSPDSNQSNSTELTALLPFIKAEDVVRTTVPAITLPEFCVERNIIAIDTLKIDIQGGEYKALSGSKGILAISKIALVEACFITSDAIDLLKLLDEFYDKYETINEVYMGADLKFYRSIGSN